MLGGYVTDLFPILLMNKLKSLSLNGMYRLFKEFHKSYSMIFIFKSYINMIFKSSFLIKYK